MKTIKVNNTFYTVINIAKHIYKFHRKRPESNPDAPGFEYPDYLGCRKQVKHLSSDVIDAIQDSHDHLWDGIGCSSWSEKEFISFILSNTCFNFFDEFVAKNQKFGD